MKTIMRSLLLLFAVLSSSVFAADTYTLDPEHSYVLWHVSHFNFSNPSGKWYVNGTLLLDETKPQNSKIEVTVDIKSLSTGLPELDKHLLSSDFFDADKFQTATFVSRKITLIGKDTANVYGDLTLHGITQPVTLRVKLNKIATSPITQKKTAGFTASTTIERSDFGIDKYLPGLGNNIKIEIEAEATLKDKA
jgi:polyisoprenoid-binding protein YceI